MNNNPKTSAVRRSVIWVLTLAFALRVAAQALQYWLPQPFLPPFNKFQGSNLPYWILLSSQLLILAFMLRICLRMQAGTLAPHRKLGGALFWFGGIYMAGSVLRVVAGLAMPEAHEWFRAWISAMFHLVLAGFILALASYHREENRQ